MKKAYTCTLTFYVSYLRSGFAVINCGCNLEIPLRYICDVIVDDNDDNDDDDNYND